MEDLIKVLSVSEPDSDGMVNMEIDFVDEDFYNRIKIFAETAGISVEDYIVEALTDFLEKTKEGEDAESE